MKIYFKQLRRLPVLTREKEAEILARMKAGDADAAKDLVVGNLRFVVAIAFKFRSKSVPVSELICCGNAALFTAAKRFDPSRGIRFVSYAVHPIKQAMSECLFAAYPYEIPEHIRLLSLTYRKIEDRFYLENGRFPDEAEYIEMLNVEPERLQSIRQISAGTVSWESLITATNTPFSEAFPDSDQLPPDHSIFSEADKNA